MFYLKGMLFINESEIKCHGNLKPSNCLVDSRWMLQITDFGLNALCEPDSSDSIDEEKYYERELIFNIFIYSPAPCCFHAGS